MVPPVLQAKVAVALVWAQPAQIHLRGAGVQGVVIHRAAAASVLGVGQWLALVQPAQVAQ